MLKISLKTCAKLLQINYIGPEIYFSSISIDTRTLEPGALFIAIEGHQFDGHDFIELAHQKKAGAIISQKPISKNLPCLEVADTKKALGIIAHYYRQQFNVPIIALTGSCGKTTTKEYLSNICNEHGVTLTAHKSFNNEIGVPLTLLALTSKHQLVIIEMGANAPGEIAWLTRITQPTIAIILNIGAAHLAGFGSLVGVAKAKTEIFQGLPSQGTAIVHANIMTNWKNFLPQNRKILVYGSHENSIVSAYSITLNVAGSAKFILATPVGSIPIQLSLLGLHQVDNALAAATAALSVGIPLATVKKGLELTKPIAGRLNMTMSYHGAKILDDSYNANPDSVKASLQVLKNYPNKRILVLGDLAELGDKTQALLASIGQYARDLGIEQLFTYGISSEYAHRAFGSNSYHFTEQKALIHALDQQLDRDYTILIKGSRSMHMEKIVQALVK